MKEGRIKEKVRQIAREDEGKDLVDIVEEQMKEIVQGDNTIIATQPIHSNFISTTEMKAHTKEMRNEMDSKFVECLMALGLDTREAYRRVNTWNAKWDSEKHGY